MVRKKRGTPKPSKAFGGSGQTSAASNKQPSQSVVNGFFIGQGTSEIPAGLYMRESETTKEIQDMFDELCADVDVGNTNKTGHRARHPKAKGEKSTRKKKRPADIYTKKLISKVVITGAPSPISFSKPVSPETQYMLSIINLDALARDREETGRPITRKLTKENKDEWFAALV